MTPAFCGFVTSQHLAANGGNDRYLPNYMTNTNTDNIATETGESILEAGSDVYFCTFKQGSQRELVCEMRAWCHPQDIVLLLDTHFPLGISETVDTNMEGELSK